MRIRWLYKKDWIYYLYRYIDYYIDNIIVNIVIIVIIIVYSYQSFDGYCYSD